MSAFGVLFASLIAHSAAQIQLHSRYVSEGIQDSSADAAVILTLSSQTENWSATLEAVETPASDSDEVSLSIGLTSQWNQWLLAGGFSVIQATAIGESDREAQMQVDWLPRDDLNLSLAAVYGHRNDGAMIQAGISHAAALPASWVLDIAALQTWDGGYVTPGTRGLNNLELALTAMRPVTGFAWQLGMRHSIAQSALKNIGESDVSWAFVGILWD